MNGVMIGIIVYIALQLLVGFLVSRNVKTEQDYLVGGRKLGLLMATLTIFATWFGSETCLGSAGATYKEGISGNAGDPFGYSLCLILMGLFLAVPLWKRGLTTIGDLYRTRFDSVTEKVAVLIMVPTSILWAAAQIRGFGTVLGSVSTDWDIEATTTMAAAVVIIYTASGGLLADAWTDLIQGFVLIAGLVVLFAVVMASGDAPALDTLPPERLSLMTDKDTFWSFAERWAVPLFGSVIAAELISRVLAARSPQVARRSALMAGGVYLLIGLIPIYLGLIGARMFPGLEDSEQVLIVHAQHHFHDFFYIVFAGAIVSAILSTVDTTLLTAGSLTAHNVVLPLMKAPSERTRLLVNRGLVVASGIAAYLYALEAESVSETVEEASSLGSAGIFVTIVFGLFTGFGGRWAAISSLVLGLAAYLLLTYWSRWGMEAVVGEFEAANYPYLCSLATAFSAYVLAGIRERKSPANPATV
ncbi:MAG: sodium:solute symporter family protein [Planctomycetaceae bacterium]|nr:sodium:solute symporter family protein [Planctomycetaceae bacterium]